MTEMSEVIVVALIGALSTIIAAIIAIFKDRRASRQANINTSLLKEIHDLRISFDEGRKKLAESTLKANILDRLGELGIFNEIKNSIDRIFEKTRADRFLIIFSMNGTHEFRAVSIAFEIHRNPKSSNAIVRYRDVEIDDSYRELIHQVEKQGNVDLLREDMKPQILKDFYTIEGINTIKLTFIERKHLDSQNDVVIFGTLAAEETDGWTELETAIINTEYEGTLKPIIRAFL